MLAICPDAVVPCEACSDLLGVVLRMSEYKHQAEPQRQMRVLHSLSIDQGPALFREAVNQTLVAAPYEQAIPHLRDGVVWKGPGQHVYL